MAKYDITYSCGHAGTVNLTGKHTERDRKLEWLETVPCWRCKQAAERKAEAAKPIAATITLNAQVKDPAGYPAIIVSLTGGTIHKIEEIRERGYSWRDEDTGVMGMLSMSRPGKVWTIRLPYTEDEDEFARNLKTATKGLAEKLVNKINPIDIAICKEIVAQQKQADADRAVKAITAGPKPERPESWPRKRNPGHWNGKFYGAPGRWNYYVDNVNHKLTDDEYDECMAYSSAYDKWEEATK